jgi:hypothetical protein
MSNELEGDRALVVNLESLGSMVLVTIAEFDIPAVRTRFQVNQIVRFLLERGLRFRNLGFCGHDLI